MILQKILSPTLLLDEQKCLANIEKMTKKMSNLIFRPHFKTHQSRKIGQWFKDFGVSKITVSSLEMAKYFSQDFSDITIAFPVNLREIDEINLLSQKISLNILVTSYEVLEFLEKNAKFSLNIFVKIDSGMHRTGILPEQFNEISQILEFLKTAEKLNFKGFLTHAGHSYQAKNRKEILEIHEKTISLMKNLKTQFSVIYPNLELSVGDTPCCSVAENFCDIDEVRPGNFVFYDVQQFLLGSCSTEEIAVSLASPVVAKHEERNEIILHSGAVHLSKDFAILPDGQKIFGLAVQLFENQWSKPFENTFLRSISQEHGILKTNPEIFEKIKIGDLIGILPVHSCLTVKEMKNYLTFEGEIIEKM